MGLISARGKRKRKSDVVHINPQWGSKQRWNTKKDSKKPSRVRAPSTPPQTPSQTKRKEETVSLYSLTNAPDPTNSPNPRSPATRADDDGVGAVESDEAI